LFSTLHVFVLTNMFWSLVSLVIFLGFLLINMNLHEQLFPRTYVYYSFLMVYNLMLKLLNEQLTLRARYNFFKLVLFVFIFLSLNNFLGIIPYSFAVTGQLMLTITMAFNLFLWMNIFAIIILKQDF